MINLKHTAWLTCISLSLMLVGCANNPQNLSHCDSTKADPSMWEKLRCDTGGAYRQQVKDNEQQLLDARAENQLFHQIYAEIEAQQQAVKADLKTQQQQQAQLQQSLNTLLSQLKTKHANKADAQQQLANLEAQIKRTQQQANNNNPAVIAAKRKELAELQRQVSRLQLSLGY